MIRRCTVTPSVSMRRNTTVSSPCSENRVSMHGRFSSRRTSSDSRSRCLRWTRRWWTITPNCRFWCRVPCRGYELQPSREGTEAAFFREKGNGVALQFRRAHRRTRETEPPDCGTFKGNGGEMVAKISVGNSLYGAIAYNGEKINEAQGRLLTTNRIYNDGSGKVDINKAMEGFLTFSCRHKMKVEKPVVHISLNPHPEDALTDAELQDIAREYLEKLGFGNQPYLVLQARGHRPPPPAHRDGSGGREREMYQRQEQLLS